MFQETYNYRYLLQLSFTQTSDKNDDINCLMYLNLMDACVGRDELSLYNNLLQKSRLYSQTENRDTHLLNLSIKITKYLNREIKPAFNQEKNVLTFESNLVQTYRIIANMFLNKKCYFHALKWINKVFEYYDKNKISNEQPGVIEEKNKANNLKDEISKEYENYKTNIQKEQCNFNDNKISKNKNTFYINKTWYNEYRSFVTNTLNNSDSFPREIDNHELLSGKDMLEKEQYILDETKKDQAIQIGEDEWVFLKNIFGCTAELPVDLTSNKFYKVLVIDANDRFNNSFAFFKPKYLILNNNKNSLHDYVKNKYNSNKNIRIYTYKDNLTKRKIKDTLFEIMFYYSMTKEDHIKIHQNIIREQPNNKSTINTKQIIFIDTDNFIAIQNKDICFNCDQKITSKQYIKFCSESCKNNYKSNHSLIRKYKTFYNHNKKPLENYIINSKEGGLVGLTNLGNTCYMNAGLQCLLHCDALVNYFFQNIYEYEPLNSQDDKSITNQFKLLAKNIWKIEQDKYIHSLNPTELRNAFKNKEEKYNNYSQQDCPEFITDFLDELSKEVNRSKSTYYIQRKNSLTTTLPIIEFGRKLNRINSIVEDLFYGQIRNQFKCNNPQCQNILNVYESFLLLDIPICSQKSIRGVIKFKYFQFEKLKPITKEFDLQIEDTAMTVGEFKRKYSNSKFRFDIFNIKYNSKLEELKDNDLLFEEDSNKQIKIRNNLNEIVLYETSDKTKYNHPFFYPFTAQIKEEIESFFDFSFLSCFCLNSEIQSEQYEINFQDFDEIKYPIRVQIKKDENVNYDFWESLRRRIFNDLGKLPPQIQDDLEFNGLIYEKQISLYSPNQINNNKWNPFNYTKIPYEQSNCENANTRYLFLSYDKSDLPKDLFTNKQQPINQILNNTSKQPLNIYDLLNVQLNPKVKNIQCKQCGDLTTLISTISKLPVYFCLYIKRFVYDNKSQQFKKISTYIDFPETLNIFKYIDTEPNYSFEENSTSKDCEYELFAVIEHRSDNILHGHYVSNIKVRNKWYLFNDGHVFENDKFKNENSFVLFYKRKSAFK